MRQVKGNSRVASFKNRQNPLRTMTDEEQFEDEVYQLAAVGRYREMMLDLFGGNRGNDSQELLYDISDIMESMPDSET